YRVRGTAKHTADLARSNYYHRLGADCMVRGDYEKAIDYLDKAEIERSGDDVRVLLDRAWCLFYLGRYEAAGGHFFRAVSRPLVSSIWTPRERRSIRRHFAEGLHGSARCAYFQGEYEKAESLLLAAIQGNELYPLAMCSHAASDCRRDHTAWLLLGWCRFNRGAYAAAREAFTTSLDLAAANPEAWLGIGWCDYYLGCYGKVSHAVTKGLRRGGDPAAFRQLEAALASTRSATPAAPPLYE
ncbi:tetratricopeptide repeat protein, partial [bacterium]|nr:tetratricopeptide repeat protein [candidate division CSSED10-310 bacterium]